MQLTRFSDLGLRLVMYLAVNARDTPPITVAEVALQFKVARNHLVKVSAALTRHGYITSLRGRTGGITLARSPDDIRLGDLVKLLESGEQLIDCASLHCPLHPGCELKYALTHALSTFYATLNTYTLEAVLKSNSKSTIQNMQYDYIRLVI